MSALIHDLNVTFLLFVVAIIGLSLVTVIVRAQRRPVTTGVEGMIGSIVVASTALLPEGRVSYKGEDWTAVLDAPSIAADPGTELRIVSVEGLLLHVQQKAYSYTFSLLLIYPQIRPPCMCGDHKGDLLWIVPLLYCL